MDEAGVVLSLLGHDSRKADICRQHECPELRHQRTHLLPEDKEEHSQQIKPGERYPCGDSVSPQGQRSPRVPGGRYACHVPQKFAHCARATTCPENHRQRESQLRLCSLPPRLREKRPDRQDPLRFPSAFWECDWLFPCTGPDFSLPCLLSAW